MTHFRIRYKRLGGHVHVGLWSGTQLETTHGKSGDLVFTEEEWQDFFLLIRKSTFASSVEVVPQDLEVSYAPGRVPE